jgi:hypothetical protein
LASSQPSAKENDFQVQACRIIIKAWKNASTRLDVALFLTIFRDAVADTSVAGGVECEGLELVEEEVTHVLIQVR